MAGGVQGLVKLRSERIFCLKFKVLPEEPATMVDPFNKRKHDKKGMDKEIRRHKNNLLKQATFLKMNLQPSRLTLLRLLYPEDPRCQVLIPIAFEHRRVGSRCFE